MADEGSTYDPRVPDLEAKIAELEKENGDRITEIEDLNKKVEDLEDLLKSVRAEVTALKKYAWGMTDLPPTVKPNIC